MKHLKEAFDKVSNIEIGNKTVGEFMSIENNKIIVEIQDGVISESGVNGIQITDLLNYIKEVYKSLNSEFSCRENALTITKIEEGLHWQDARTKDRIKRNVESKNLK